jgi:hypothetical protein
MKQSVAFTLLLFTAITRADDFDTWLGASPDKKLFAVERRIPSPDNPSRLDLDSCTVYISTGLSDQRSDGAGQGPVIAQHTFAGRVISQIRWSPDSKFLLFTTASSGGHSPWHFKTFVFCAQDKSFHDVESATGAPVGASEFHFEPPDIAVLELYDPTGGEPKQIKLPLGKTAQKMERLE